MGYKEKMGNVTYSSLKSIYLGNVSLFILFSKKNKN